VTGGGLYLLEDEGYNPFRACKKQLTINVATPRSGVTEPQEVFACSG
jgi:hypothetical protein